MTETRPPRSDVLRVALAGAGMISHYHLTAWSRLGNRAKVVAIADPDRAKAALRAEAFGIPAVYADVEDMLTAEHVDAIDIASPRETHAQNVEHAASRGIDVLCQKPLAPTLALSESLVLGVGSRVRLMVHENWRFRPWYRRMRTWLDEGAVGDLLLGNMASISSALLPDATGKSPALVRQPFMAGEARLLIAESLIHEMDVVRWLMGPLRVVAARASRSIDEVKGETLSAIFMETANGAPVIVTGTMTAPGFPSRGQDRFELIGTKGSAVVAGTQVQLLGPRSDSQEYDFDEGYQASFDGVIAHFVDCLESGATFETNPTDNLETLRLVEHAYWAAGLHNPNVGP
jgi:predicted dehydrogenase